MPVSGFGSGALQGWIRVQASVRVKGPARSRAECMVPRLRSGGMLIVKVAERLKDHPGTSDASEREEAEVDRHHL